MKTVAFSRPSSMPSLNLQIQHFQASRTAILCCQSPGRSGRGTPLKSEQSIRSPAFLGYCLLGFSLCSWDVNIGSSAHLLQGLDLTIQQSVAATQPVSHPVASGLVSSLAISGGLAGWALSSALLLSRPSKSTNQLAICVAFYLLGGGSIYHGDPLLVDALKRFFHRARPSLELHSFAFPSGHTTAATFIVGALLFILLPAALSANTPPSEAEQDSPPSKPMLQDAAPQNEGAPQEGGSLGSTVNNGLPGGRSWNFEAGRMWLREDVLFLVWALAIVCTAAGRVLAEAHWVSDTIAGAFLGAALVSAAAICAEAVDDSDMPSQ